MDGEDEARRVEVEEETYVGGQEEEAEATTADAVGGEKASSSSSSSSESEARRLVAIITGATSGIGFETAKALFLRGFHVILACRDENKCEKVIADIHREAERNVLLTPGSAECMSVDLTSLQSVRDFAAAFKKKNMHLNVLINNAGIYCPPYTETKDGFESQFGVNYLSHFLLTDLLLDKLKESAPSRIINVSSRAHTMANLDFNNLQTKAHYNRFVAYSRSKLAQVLHAYKLQRDLEGTGVTCSALHPGVVNTYLWRDLPGPFKHLAYGLGSLFFKTPAQGAATTIWAATSEKLEGVGGKYFVDCREIKSSAQSYNLDAQEKLWRASRELVGLPSDDEEEKENA